MSVTQQSATERVTADRGRYVARGVSTPKLVVAQADGARVTDVDGRSFIDFAGGIGCQNTGHGFAPVVAAIHEQVDRYLHQCFMVGTYEPYVEVCRRLAELSPCGSADQQSVLVNSGAEAIENAVKIARVATGRPAVVVFDNAFHGRTLLTMTMTSKVKPYKAGFGPFAPEVYRTPAPYPYRGITSTDAIAGLEHLFKGDVDPESVACVVLEPVQGEGGFVVDAAGFPARLLELCREHGILYVDDEVQSGVGRTGKMWAIEHYGVEPDLLVSGKSLGGGLPLAGVTGPRRADGRGPARRARRHVRRQPALVRRGARRARRGRRSRSSSPRRPRSATRCARGSTRSRRARVDRRGARARPDARDRVRRADARPRGGRRRGGVRDGLCCCSRAASTGT